MTRLAAGKRTVVIAKAGAGNYGHTLVEILPKLISIARSPLRDIRLLLPQSMAKFTAIILALCRHFGVAAELAFVPQDDLAEVENLVYFGPVSLHNSRKSTTLLSLRDAVWQCLDITPAPTRRLYVERQPPGIRNLTNGAAVRAVFEDSGYQTVHPAALSFEEQAMLFSQASHIAGPLGAGLTNSLLAAPQCRVLMIDPGLADYFFWDLATLAGQSFTWMFSGPVFHWSWPLASSDFTVNLDGLRYALAGAGRARIAYHSSRGGAGLGHLAE